MLVAKETNRYQMDDLFAATPPLGALKLIISMAMPDMRKVRTKMA